MTLQEAYDNLKAAEEKCERWNAAREEWDTAGRILGTDLWRAREQLAEAVKAHLSREGVDIPPEPR